MIRFTGVNHLAFATGDMDKTVRFWRDLLGMRLIATLGQPGFRHYFFELSPTDTVAFFEWDGVEGVEEKAHGVPVRGPFIFDHVSFGVDSADDLWGLKDKMVAAGLEVSDVIDHGFIHSIYTFDPNGIPIEFSYNVPGLDVRAEPLFGDRAPTATAREGSEPDASMWPAVQRQTPRERRFTRPGAGSELVSYGYKKAQ
jgi:catechol 2,3-dioxygenase-like lactoylglutathione lyase family enzyme